MPTDSVQEQFGGGGGMTAEEWRGCTEPDLMLVAVNDVATDQQLRLWSCACVRRVWHRLAGAEAGRRAVEVAEAFARGAVGASELGEARLGAETALRHIPVSHAWDHARDALQAAAWCATEVMNALSVARSVAWGSTYAAVGQEDRAGIAVERAAQAELLRSFVNFQPE